MQKEKPRLARLTAIITQLQSKNLVTARDIAEKHDISIRTVYRDIRTLEASGIPIITEEGKGYSIMEGYKLPPIMFNEEEANALITAEHIIRLNKDKSLAEQYTAAIEKIKSVLRFSQKNKTELLSERMVVRKQKNVQQSSTYLIKVQKALTNFQVVHLDYLSLTDKKSQRDVEPFALINTQDGQNWLLIAYCRMRKDFRAFRLDKIQKLHVTLEVFTPHEMTLQQFFIEARKKWENTPDTPLTQGRSTFASNQKILIMQKVEIKPFQVIGITVTTSNENMQVTQDIGALWGKFMSEGIVNQIPNKVNSNIYSIYTNYQGDHTKPYDVILGCAVHSLKHIPEGMVGQSFEGGHFGKFEAKGDLNKGVVYQTWEKVWAAGLDRNFQADFELYGEKAQNPAEAEVEIFVGVQA